MGTRNKNSKENFIVKLIRIILLIVLCPFVMVFLIKTKIKKVQTAKSNEEKVKIYSISQINSLSGVEFENYLKLLFEKMGYIVQTTKKSKDFGVDLIIEKNKKKTIVQTKRYSHTVGISAVQEIISARNHYGIYSAMVVSNQNFSKEAETLANENNVMLAGKAELESLVAKYPVYFKREKRKYVATTLDAVKEIEKRYPYWI
ncbi:MAG: restriction endonuclease [Clostridia bacterium]|nr:restriction endonuclease [Clostridia bacterium]